MQLNCTSEKHRTCLKAKCAFPLAYCRAPGRGCGWQRSPGITRALQKSFVTSVPFLCCAAVQSHPSVSHLSCGVKAAAIPKHAGLCHPLLDLDEVSQVPEKTLCNARALSLPWLSPGMSLFPLEELLLRITSQLGNTSSTLSREANPSLEYFWILFLPLLWESL